MNNEVEAFVGELAGLRAKVKKQKRIIDELKTALNEQKQLLTCLLYTSPSPRDRQKSRMPSSA